MAPGPPTAIAVATPARFPVPTRVATDTAKAWNDDTCLRWICLSVRLPIVDVAESVSNLNISPIMRNCTPFVLIVNHRPQITNAPTSPTPQMVSFSCVINSFISFLNNAFENKRDVCLQGTTQVQNSFSPVSSIWPPHLGQVRLSHILMSALPQRRHSLPTSLR